MLELLVLCDSSGACHGFYAIVSGHEIFSLYFP